MKQPLTNPGSPAAPGNYEATVYLHRFAYSGHFYKRNHATCGFSRLASLTRTMSAGTVVQPATGPRSL